MRTPRRKRPTDLDFAKLRKAHTVLLDLMRGLSPSTPEYQATERAFDGIRTCAIDWTSNADFWISCDANGYAGRSSGFVKGQNIPVAEVTVGHCRIGP